MTDADTVLLEVTGTGVAVLTFNRPDRLNAWISPWRTATSTRCSRPRPTSGCGPSSSPGPGAGSARASTCGSGDDPKLYGSLDRRPTTLPLFDP